jgi:hypothetical protein
MKNALFPLCLLVSPGLFACTETVVSGDVRTTGISPEFSITADGLGSTRASARLKVGGNDSNTFLTLQGGDRLEVSVDDDTRALESVGSHRYEASFPVDAGGTEFVFSFLRSEADESAPSSRLTLPEPFELTMVGTEASRETDRVGFGWDSTTTGEVRWNVDGDCVWADDGVTPDDGSHTLDATDLRARLNRETESCTVRLTLERFSAGSLDPAFTEGGEGLGRQQRVQSFTSMP